MLDKKCSFYFCSSFSTIVFYEFGENKYFGKIHNKKCIRNEVKKNNTHKLVGNKRKKPKNPNKMSCVHMKVRMKKRV